MNSASRDVVCIGRPSWGGDYQKSTVRLMQALAGDHRVLYVEYAPTWSDWWRSRSSQSPVSWRGAMRRELSAEGVTYVLTPPPVPPVNALPAGVVRSLLVRAGAWVVRRAVRRAMAALDIHAPVLVNALHPELGCALAGTLGEVRSIYYCYDDIASAPWIARHGTPAEAAFMPMVDCVVASSASLQARLAQVHPDCRLVPNGVDFAHWRTATIASATARPCAGYIGSLDTRVDWALLDVVCEMAPDFDFLFVGRITDPAAHALAAKHPNVTLAQAQPAATLPAWVSRMHVGMIPFRCDRFTAHIYPLKINEYLAAGRPVVMTPFAALGEFDQVARTAASAGAFVQALREAVRDSDDDTRAMGVAHAARCDWSARAAAFAGAISA